MPDYYYSTQVFLAWCFHHYFYNAQHWSYAGKPFYTYRLTNPRSSNPLKVYEDTFEPWKVRDSFSGHLAQKRLNVRKGVVANAHLLRAGWEGRLKCICDDVDIVFFYPIVYRIDMLSIPTTRRTKAGSGTIGSKEYLIENLLESEFDILFLDFDDDSDFVLLRDGNISSQAALNILEGRCQP